jgi:TRAP-type C4-dicarboxylate transport system substrate-binding protein
MYAARIILAVAALSATVISAEPTHAETKLIYSSTVSAVHPVSKRGLEPYFKKIEADTGGALKFEIFPGGTLSSPTTTLKAIGNGTVDMGLLADVYNPTDVPVSTTISDLAVFGKDARVMTGAVNQMLLVDCPECRNDYLRNKVIPLASYSLTPYYFMCAKAPVRSLDEIKGKKIRATGSMGQLVAALGGVPVNITSSEMYEAVQRGQADCAAGPLPWLKTYTMWEVANSVTFTPIGTYHGTNIANMTHAKWKKLAPKERQAFIKHLPALVRDMAQGYEEDDQSIKGEAEAKGVKWYDADPALAPAIDKFRAGEVARVAALAKSRKVKDPEPMIDQFRKNVDKWTKIVNDIGPGVWKKEQWDKYEAALKTEVFDKGKFE